MPELPEVQTVVNGLNRVAKGQHVRDIKIHWPGYLKGIEVAHLREILKGQKFNQARRRGKYIIIEMDKCYFILHLRMTGKVLNLDHYETIDKHMHAEILFEEGLRLGLSDVRKFGRLEYVSNQDIKTRLDSLDLGPEPLDPEFNPEFLHRRINRSQRPLKSLLLDQKIVAGLGNIYVCEILFRSKLSPEKLGQDVTLAEVERLVENTKKILEYAIEKGGSSIRDYVNVDGKSGEMQNHFEVYGLAGEPCALCETKLERIKQSGRSTFFCPECQR